MSTFVQYLFTIDPYGQSPSPDPCIAGALVNSAAPAISKYLSASSGLLNFKTVSVTPCAWTLGGTDTRCHSWLERTHNMT